MGRYGSRQSDERGITRRGEGGGRGGSAQKDPIPDPEGDGSIEAVVFEFSSRWIKIALPSDKAAAIQGGGWRMDVFASTVSYERSKRAIERFSERGDHDRCEPLPTFLSPWLTFSHFHHLANGSS